AQVLVHRVRGALVPAFLDLLLRRHDLDVLVETALEKAPAPLQVANEALRLVLRGDADASNARVEAIRQREIDDAKLAAEGNRGLRAPVRELVQAAAAAAGQHHREGALRELRHEAF